MRGCKEAETCLVFLKAKITWFHCDRILVVLLPFHMCSPLSLQDAATAIKSWIPNVEQLFICSPSLHRKLLSSICKCSLPISSELIKAFGQRSDRSCWIHVEFRVLYNDTWQIWRSMGQHTPNALFEKGIWKFCMGSTALCSSKCGVFNISWLHKVCSLGHMKITSCSSKCLTSSH